VQQHVHVPDRLGTQAAPGAAATDQQVTGRILTGLPSANGGRDPALVLAV
jgi:hypothetical protein